MLGMFLCLLGMACLWILARRFQFDDEPIWKEEKEGAIVYFNVRGVELCLRKRCWSFEI